jgi:hypothetical protein
MRNPKLIFSLVLAGFLLIGSATFLVTVGRNIGQFFFGRSFSEAELRDYVSKVTKQQVNGASCQPYDTDGNGYVSCDYTTVADPNTPRPIECAAWGLDGFLNRGCKARVPSF